MISCKFFYQTLVNRGVRFFTGVPDSLLKHFCAYVTDHSSTENHIIAANEGGAVALASGHYLATGKPGLVYMQNSGQGNALNPLVSLADPDVYSIPLLLVIGWRGEPGKKDEPQHVKQGKVTLPLLETLGIDYEILPDEEEAAIACIEKVFRLMNTKSCPVAIVVKKETFEPYQLQQTEKDLFEITREEAIKALIDKTKSSDIVVSTTGKTSRELYEYRDQLDGDHSRDFLIVGSMGHASQIALSIALAKPDRQVFCLDGDGAAIMHMGALAIIGSQKPVNFSHIIINNGAHDSVGGQPTAGFAISFPDIAKACGYKTVLEAKNLSQINQALETISTASGPAMLEIKVRKGTRANLGRPKTTPKQNRDDFMEHLSR